MYDKLKQELQDNNIITNKGQINKQAGKMLNNFPDLTTEIINQTSFLRSNTSLAIRLRIILLNISETPTCRVCGRELYPLRYIYTKKRFAYLCQNTEGTSCAHKDQPTILKRENTLLEHYGVTHQLQNSQIKEKIRQTCQERYGGKSPMCDPVIKQKVRDKFSNCDHTKIVEKRINTNILRYNAPTFAQGQLNEEVRQRILTLSYDKEWLQTQHHKKGRTITDIAAEIGISTAPLCNRFKSLDIPILHNTTSNKSKEELEIYEMITQSLSDTTIQNDRVVIAPYELDIYIPTFNLAIEYCGIFWHSELNGRSRNYHLKKFEKCGNKGIRLIQVWSNEWRLKKEIVKSRILHAMGLSTSIYARKCIVEQLNSSQEKEFFDNNHIQGYTPSTICYGLKINNEWIAAMSFIRSRFTQKYEWELLRYCCLRSFSVVGGANKLFKHFMTNHSPSSIVSYCDLRWGNGGLYKQLGFVYSHNSAPNYFYFDRYSDTNMLFSRVKFQKHKLKDVLQTFDSELSEWHNMVNHGYDRIWDCGNSVWSYNPNNPQ